MTDWALAQLNIAHLLAPLDSPELSGFVANLDRINTLAEQSPGFIWRLKGELVNTAISMRAFGPDVIPNLSVWSSIDALHDFTYRTAHVEVMSQRKHWFSRIDEAHMVLWWVPRDHRPTLIESSQRLNQLRESGATADAFSFKTAFPPPAKSAN